MYVECLKKQVAELLAKQQQIDSGIFEPLSGTQAEEITIRKAIIQTFLQVGPVFNTALATSYVDQPTPDSSLFSPFFFLCPLVPNHECARPVKVERPTGRRLLSHAASHAVPRDQHR